MSKFFEDVGDVVSLPYKTVYNFATNNPKGNSLEDVWNNTVGEGNPYQNVISDNPAVGGLKKLTGADLSAPFQAPSWEELGKPAQAFSSSVDQKNKALPSVLQPYAQPVEAIALSAFNPYAGAAFNTAYQAGQNQAQPGAFDWGALGKDAALNFGTAALASGANKLVSNANQANTAKAATENFGVPSLTHSYDSAIPGVSPGFAGTNAAPLNFSFPSQGGASTSIFSSFNPKSSALDFSSSGGGALQGINATESALPVTSSSQAPSGQGIYKSAVNAVGKNLGPQALAATLAPQGNQPISGSFDQFAPVDTGAAGSGVQYGDLLNAFGGPEGNIANPGGPRYGEQSINDAVSRLGANNYFQQTEARDKALPAGQYTAPQNTPYANRLSEINKGTDQSYQDLMDQIQNANNYFGIIDSNPGLTADDLNKYLQDPNSGVLGSFTVPQESIPYLQNIKPVGLQNSSLL